MRRRRDWVGAGIFLAVVAVIAFIAYGIFATLGIR
jgi:hypothetical protein